MSSALEEADSCRTEGAARRFLNPTPAHSAHWRHLLPLLSAPRALNSRPPARGWPGSAVNAATSFKIFCHLIARELFWGPTTMLTSNQEQEFAPPALSTRPELGRWPSRVTSASTATFYCDVTAQRTRSTASAFNLRCPALTLFPLWPPAALRPNTAASDVCSLTPFSVCEDIRGGRFLTDGFRDSVKEIVVLLIICLISVFNGLKSGLD